MLRRLVTLAVRTLRRRLTYTLVSAVGLTVGLACVVLVARYLAFETSYDTFHPDADRIGRVYRTINDAPADRPNPKLASLVGQEMKRRVAGIEHVTALGAHNRPTFLEPTDASAEAARRIRIDRQDGMYVPPGDEFLQVFGGFEVLHGDPATALTAPGDALVTAPTARALFGTTDAVGRTLTLTLGAESLGGRTVEGGRETLTIRAVTAAPPANSHFTYRLVYAAPPSSFWRQWTAAHTYVKLTPGADRQSVVDAILPAWDAVKSESWDRWNYVDRFEGAYEPLTDIHLHSTARYPLGRLADVRYLWALGLLGVVILAVVGTNFTNLTAVLYAGRSQEVGTRKALGARRDQVARQFASEAAVLALGCVPPAMGLAAALTPAFNRLMDVPLPNPAMSPLAWLGLGAGAVALGGVAALYPAWGVARRSVPQLFAGSAFGRTSGFSARRVLVVAQFALFIALGSGAVLMQQQVDLMQDRDLGFEPDNLAVVTNGAVLTAPIDASPEAREVSASKTFQNRLRAHPSVDAVSSGNYFLDEDGSTTRTMRMDADTAQGRPTTEARWHYMSPDALPVLGLSPRAGAYFDRPASMRRDSVAVVTPAVLAALGCTEAELPAGCTIRYAPRNSEDSPDVSVVGVVEPAQFASLRYGSPPLVLMLVEQSRRPYRYLHNVYARFRNGTPRTEQQRVLEAAWGEVVPDSPMQTAFVADDVEAFYAQDRRLRTLALGLTGVALVLVTLGLVAVAAYLTRLRMKEVAIRKVLGASVTGLLARLNREFVALVGIAFVIGSLGASLAMDRWLDGFATRIPMSPLVFAAVGLGALALAVGAVSWQSLKAARVDPATVLRAE